MSNETVVETYSFKPAALAPERRLPGISAFMRIKNGADFLEATIRSHIDHFDEIVAVYNQCTDATPDILARLAQEYGDKLRVFHYLPKVFPPGSDGHAKEPANSPRSLVNYYNFALAQTRHAVATKLDDDHLAMPTELAALVQRARVAPLSEMLCFSGLNLARGNDGEIGILATEPFSGTGDIGLFPVSLGTYFTPDPRFERFRRGVLRRHFGAIVYWHLKYLKPGLGFANYELTDNPNSRYRRRLTKLGGTDRLITAKQLAARTGTHSFHYLPFSEKRRLARDRTRAFRNAPPTDASLREALATLGIISTLA